MGEANKGALKNGVEDKGLKPPPNTFQIRICPDSPV